MKSNLCPACPVVLVSSLGSPTWQALAGKGPSLAARQALGLAAERLHCGATFFFKGVVSGGTVGFIDIKDTHEICHDFLLISDTWLYMIFIITPYQKNTWKITYVGFFVKTDPLWSVSKVHHVWVSCIDVDCTQSRHLFTFSEPNL